MKIKINLLLLLLLLVSSCGGYEKILKSNDFELKKTKALEYFEMGNEGKIGKYVKANQLLAQILPRYRATDEAEHLSWVSIQCYYNSRDYMTAGAAYKNFFEAYPFSEHTEEATYMSAYCDYLASPRPQLDQSYTMAAIESFQYYLNRYPDGDDKKEATELIKELEDNLVEKSYLSAKLYHDLDQYRAAIVALNNSLKEYPETKFREELLYLKLESTLKYAQRSISSKQVERYQDTLDEYYSFVEEFKESQFKKEIARIYKLTAIFLKIDLTNKNSL